ncbi:MAG: hypothetical protein WCQ50_09720 [Spirochaetota bacterium]
MALRQLARILALTPLLGLISCQNLAALLGLTDPFALYRNPADNFIAASDLDKQDLSSAGFERTAVWTWAWRGGNDTNDAAGGFSYMSLEAAGTVAAGTLTGVSKDIHAFRLGLVNLIAGGDFEGANSTTTALVNHGWSWTESDPVLAQLEPTVAISATDHAINGNTLSVSIKGLNNKQLQDIKAFRYAISSLADSSNTQASHNYAMTFFAAGSSDIGWQAWKSPDSSDFQRASSLQQIYETTALEISPFYSYPGSDSFLVFGKTMPIVFWMDNLRVMRTDLAGDYRLRLLLSPKDTVPELIGGWGWKFSLWVRKPAGHFFPDEAGAREPYASKKVTLRILQTAQTPEGGSQDASYDVYDVPTNGEWTKMELKITNKNSTLFFPTQSLGAVIELAIFPFDSARPEPGFVEISDPEFTVDLEYKIE